MGAWGYGIIDNDKTATAIDIIIEQIMGEEFLDDSGFFIDPKDWSLCQRNQIREKFDKHPNLNQVIGKAYQIEQDAAWLGFACVAMGCGGVITEKQRSEIIAAISLCNVDADAYDDPSKRRVNLNEFLTLLNTYKPGTPMYIKDKPEEKRGIQLESEFKERIQIYEEEKNSGNLWVDDNERMI